MIYSFGKRVDLEKLDELVSLQKQVKASRLQDKPGKQNVHKDTKKLIKPVTKSFKGVSQDVTKTITDTAIANNKALTNLNDKILNIMIERDKIASYLLSPLSKITNPEYTRQNKLTKHPDSNRVHDLLKNKTKPVTVYDYLLTFRDTKEEFEWNGELLKMINFKNYKTDLAKLSVSKLMFDFAKEMFFDEKAIDNNSIRVKTLNQLLKPHAITVLLLVFHRLTK